MDRKDVSRAALQYNAVNDEISSIRLHEQPFHMTIVQVYAKITAAKEREI